MAQSGERRGGTSPSARTASRRAQRSTAVEQALRIPERASRRRRTSSGTPGCSGARLPRSRPARPVTHRHRPITARAGRVLREHEEPPRSWPHPARAPDEAIRRVYADQRRVRGTAPAPRPASDRVDPVQECVRASSSHEWAGQLADHDRAPPAARTSAWCQPNGSRSAQAPSWPPRVGRSRVAARRPAGRCARRVRGSSSRHRLASRDVEGPTATPIAARMRDDGRPVERTNRRSPEQTSTMHPSPLARCTRARTRPPAKPRASSPGRRATQRGVKGDHADDHSQMLETLSSGQSASATRRPRAIVFSGLEGPKVLNL